MLDDVGLPQCLGIRSSAELFAQEQGLVHMTSVIRYPVFVGANEYANYTGHGPPLMNHPTLRSFIVDYLAPELASLQKTLVVPLGKCVEEALQYLIVAGMLDQKRCLIGFPHPSGANGHRGQQYALARGRLADQVKSFGERPTQ